MKKQDGDPIVSHCQHGTEIQQCFEQAKANQGKFEDACILNLYKLITRFYRRYNKSLYQQEADTQDFTQEFFVERILSKILPDYENIIASKEASPQSVSQYLSNYISAAVRNFCTDIYRKNQKYKEQKAFHDVMEETLSDKKSIPADIILERGEEYQKINDCVEQLRISKKGKSLGNAKQNQRIYHVAILYHKKANEIEEETGVKPNTQYKYIQTAILSIYQCLKNKGFELPPLDNEQKEKIKKMLEILAEQTPPQ